MIAQTLDFVTNLTGFLENSVGLAKLSDILGISLILIYTSFL